MVSINSRMGVSNFTGYGDPWTLVVLHKWQNLKNVFRPCRTSSCMITSKISFTHYSKTYDKINKNLQKDYSKGKYPYTVPEKRVTEKSVQHIMMTNNQRNEEKANSNTSNYNSLVVNLDVQVKTNNTYSRDLPVVLSQPDTQVQMSVVNKPQFVKEFKESQVTLVGITKGSRKQEYIHTQDRGFLLQRSIHSRSVSWKHEKSWTQSGLWRRENLHSRWTDDKNENGWLGMDCPSPTIWYQRYRPSIPHLPWPKHSCCYQSAQATVHVTKEEMRQHIDWNSPIYLHGPRHLQVRSVSEERGQGRQIWESKQSSGSKWKDIAYSHDIGSSPKWEGNVHFCDIGWFSIMSRNTRKGRRQNKNIFE